MMRWIFMATLLLATVRTGRAEVLGGGLVRTDCRTVFRGVTATNVNSGVVCSDGDPECDRDGVADGTCHFDVRLCTGNSGDGCETVPLSQAHVAGLHLPAPPLPSSDGTCGHALDVAVPTGSSQGATVVALDDSSLRDVDYLNLCCVSGVPTALDAARCAMATDLKASGCRTTTIPRRIRQMYGRARETVGAFTAEPTHRGALGRVLRKLAVVRSTAQRLAKHDQCGDTLGLMMTYAQNVVRAARATAPVTAP